LAKAARVPKAVGVVGVGVKAVGVSYTWRTHMTAGTGGTEGRWDIRVLHCPDGGGGGSGSGDDDDDGEIFCIYFHTSKTLHLMPSTYLIN
jgi:hypothetical protein